MPPIIIRNASLVIASSASPEGGTLVSWTSLETGAPIGVRLDTPMDAAWSSIPMYWQTFGNFGIFVIHPPMTLPEPQENPVLTGADAELLTTLEEHFDEMNTEVANSAAASRNTPPSATSPNSQRLFARIRARQVDTDSDHIWDDVEYRLMLAGHPLGNPFLADADGNGVGDGDQIDSDTDGIPDGQDISPTSNAEAIQITVPPRCALFESTGQGMPIQISDKGTVLFDKGTWTGGQYRQLPGIGDAQAIAINDQDIVLGSIWRDVTEGEHTATFLSACYWKSPASTREYVETKTGKKIYGEGIGFPWWGLPVLSNDGSFAGSARQFDDDGYLGGPGNTPSLNTWTLPSASGGACFPSRRVPDEPSVEITYASGANLMWGQEAIGDDDAAGVVYAPDKLPRLEFRPQNVVRLNSGDQTRFLALFDGHSAQLSSGGGWTESALYKPAIDAAEDGTAIGLDHSGFVTPILINGKWQEMERVTPDLPAEWRDGTAEFRDISPRGWTLAHRGRMLPDDNGYLTDPSALETGIMLPVRIKGVPRDPAFPEATGVDDFSIGSTVPGPAVGDKFWIMAPYAGEGETRLTLEAPLNESTPLKLLAPGVKFGTGAGFQLTAPSTTFDVVGTSAAVAGLNQAVIFKLGSTDAWSIPIGVKAMKARTVHVTLWRVASDHNPPGTLPGDSGYIEPVQPVFNFAEEEVEAGINKYYYPQVNAAFNVDIRNVTVRWDTSDGTLYGGPSSASHARNHYLDTDPGLGREFTAIREAANDPNADINVYLVGDCILFRTGFWQASTNKVLGHFLDGLAHINLKQCAIADGFRRTPAEYFDLIAHEIGHVVVGSGHPDIGSGEEDEIGPAPLPGTDHRKRLMCSGGLRSRDGSSSRLVKGEWDKIDAWLKDIVDRRGQ